MRLAICLGLCAGLLVGHAQDATEAFGLAVRRSLERSHALYPEAAVPGSPLSQAILLRIDWLNRNSPAFFSDPDWPVKVAALEASRLGMSSRKAAPPQLAAEPEERRYLAVVTKNFSVTGASFRKGQQVILEGLRDYGKRGVVMVEGQPVVLWLDHIKLLREIPRGEAGPLPVKITGARYGLPGTKGYVVASAVQSALTPNVNGVAELVVSDALLPPATAQRLNRSVTARAVTDPATGQPVPVVPLKVLSVTYEIGGVKKNRQAREGEVLVLD